MIYFDNAATSYPKPPAVAEAVAAALGGFGNASRGAHAWALAASRTVEGARASLADLFGCSLPERVVFTKNVTEALNLAIAALRGHIVSSEAEHNAILRPLHRRGKYSLAPVDELGRYTAADIARLITPDTEAVVVSHASNLTGNIAPLQDIAALCRERGLRLIVDAAQTAGLLDIDTAALGTDALCFTGHKSLYGPQGTGGICLGKDFNPGPLIVGGTGSRSFSLDQPEDLPDRLEAGTLNSHGIAGLAAGVEYVRSRGPGALRAAANRLADRFRGGVSAVPDLTLYGDYGAAVRVPIVSLNIGGVDSTEIAGRLAEDYDIAVRAGAHCAPLLHRRFGTVEQGAVRFSFSHCNTEEEIDFAVAAVRTLASERKSGGK
ncbi:MAG: aminotransferase class V-fold PLP-dependent enzyme [Planctomycetaceae bacterium]|nr:aminotransferase class V-fold PLP-dependent enzyme [Planctomycetaceae bacterium]